MTVIVDACGDIVSHKAHEDIMVERGCCHWIIVGGTAGGQPDLLARSLDIAAFLRDEARMQSLGIDADQHLDSRMSRMET